MHPSSENDILTARSTVMVLLMLTGLLTFCWILTEDSRIQAAAFISGMAAIMSWSSYCQQKTTAEVDHIMKRQKSN